MKNALLATLATLGLATSCCCDSVHEDIGDVELVHPPCHDFHDGTDDEYNHP